MSDFEIKLNVDEIAPAIADDFDKWQEKVRKAVYWAALQTHSKIIEYAQTTLRSSREQYVDAVFIGEPETDHWVVGLREEAMWIEEGMEPHSMVDDLLQGRRFRVIPIDQAKPPSALPAAQQSLGETFRNELKRINNKLKTRGIDPVKIKEIERNADGSPKLGGLHRVPMKSGVQGPTGTDYFRGMSVYQKQEKNKEGESVTKRFFGTFRVVVPEHKQQGRWFHPGSEPRKFVDKAYDWAINHWETEVLPDLQKSLSGSTMGIS